MYCFFFLLLFRVKNRSLLESYFLSFLQRDIVKMEMSGKEAKGVEILKRALEKARGEEKGHEAYEIEMLLVEMLIYLVCSLI